MTEPEQPVAVPLRAALEEELMTRLSSDNPKSRQHREDYADGWSSWRCIPIRDAVEVREAAIAALAVEAVRPETDIDERVRELEATIEAMSGDAADLVDVMDEAASLRTALAHVLVRTHDSGCGVCDAARALLTAPHELPSRTTPLAERPE